MENFTIDRKKKTFIFDDGEELPIPEDKVRQVLRSPYAKKIEKERRTFHEMEREAGILPESFGTAGRAANESFFGNPGATLGDYIGSAVTAFSPQEGQEEMGYVDRILDTFYAKQDARKAALAQESARNPTAAALGSGLGIAGELALLRKAPGVAAFPALGAAHSETSFLEPTEKATELARDAATGLIVDKFFGSLGKVANARSGRRAAQKATQAVEEANALNLESAAQANAAQDALYAQELAAREAAVSQRPILQEAENRAFIEASEQPLERITKTLGKENIDAASIGVEDFLENNLGRSVNAVSSEGNSASRFLRSVFKGNKEGKIGADGLKKGIRALDERILATEGTERAILSEFRNELIQNFPQKMASSYVAEKWVPKILQRTGNLEKELASITQANPQIKEVSNSLFKVKGTTNLVSEIKQAVKSAINEVGEDLVNNLNDPAFSQKLATKIRELPSYQITISQLENVFPEIGSKGTIVARQSIPGFQNLEQYLQTLPEQFSNKFVQSAERYLPDISNEFSQKMTVAQRAAGNFPQGAKIIPEPAAVVKPTPLQPNLQPVPGIPEPQNLYERLAYGLESLGGGKEAFKAAKENVPLGVLAKVSGIPVGKTLAAVGGAATGLSALTSPGIAGQFLRAGLNQGARIIQAVETRAQQYPSYHDGILDNPQERRSLTKEIEDDPNIPGEQKAILQSKINRGKPISGRLQ